MYFGFKTYEMSDSESLESQTESEVSIDHEDMAKQSSVVQPYQFEPLADNEYEEQETDEDCISRADLQARL